MVDMGKVTFTLDDETVQRIRRIAARIGKPRSHVVRLAVNAYDPPVDRLTDEERDRMLAVLDRFMKEPPTRPQAEVDAELRELRRARRHGGRLSRADSE
jgi:predicted transcriptional regulator